jgi:hypothetical protein
VRLEIQYDCGQRAEGASMKSHGFMCNRDMCGEEFLAASWTGARIIARLYDGDAALLTSDEQAIAREMLGLEVLPTEPPQELYIGAGRRSGKTRLVSVLATHAAAQDYRDRLAPGEVAVAACIAPDRRQARQLFAYCAGIVQNSPILRAEVVKETADTIEFAHRSRLEIHTGSFRAVRGYTMCFAAVDEAAFLRDERSANPDLELARALKPALKTLNGRLVVISSLHQKRGLMYDAHKRYFARASA